MLTYKALKEYYEYKWFWRRNHPEGNDAQCWRAYRWFIAGSIAGDLVFTLAIVDLIWIVSLFF